MANTKILKRSKNVYGEDLICNGKNQAIAKMFIANNNLEEDISMFVDAPRMLENNRILKEMLKEVLELYHNESNLKDTVATRLYRKIEKSIKRS